MPPNAATASNVTALPARRLLFIADPSTLMALPDLWLLEVVTKSSEDADVASSLGGNGHDGIRPSCCDKAYCRVYMPVLLSWEGVYRFSNGFP